MSPDTVLGTGVSEVINANLVLSKTLNSNRDYLNIKE